MSGVSCSRSSVCLVYVVLEASGSGVCCSRSCLSDVSCSRSSVYLVYVVLEASVSDVSCSRS